MKNNNYRSRKTPFWLKMGKLKLYAVLAATVVVIVALAVIVRSCRDTQIRTEVNDKIDLTPTQVISMREIGQWEFLSVEDEELVDTVRKGIFRDDVLTRIYFGTLRLGFDMRSVREDWLRRDADTLHVTLPRITLLDNDFIDEARTKAFYESGTWNDKARADLYKRAHEKMLRRCMTRENIKSAEENASRQVSRMFNSMGYKYVEIRFE